MIQQAKANTPEKSINDAKEESMVSTFLPYE
jgi:hypothetical protein